MPAAEQSPREFWQDRYADTATGSIWSGQVNASMAAVAADLTPGSALDLGCGEGGDALWLARHGWQVTGVDLSATAIERATDAARDAGLPVTFVAADLAEYQPPRGLDLVTASFLHSPVAFPRTEVLRRAAAAVAPGGHLLIVTHGAPPPWSEHADHHEHDLLDADGELTELALDPHEWSVRVSGEREREATGPDGQAATLTDVVVLVQRNRVGA